MKKLKKFLLPILLISVLMLCFILTSCNLKCEHEFGEWTLALDPSCSADGEEQRSCTKCGEIEKQPIPATGHNADGLVCSECGESIISAKSLFPSVDVESISSLGVVVKDLYINTIDEYGENEVSIELAELVIYINEDGELCGYGEGYGIMKDPNFDGPTEIGIYAAIEDETFYVWKKSNVEQYMISSLEALITSNDKVGSAVGMLEGLLPSLEVWINESLVPVFSTVTLPDGMDAPDLSEENIEKALTMILNLFFKVEQTEDGALIVFDTGIIKEVNNALNEKTISELVDLWCGVGTFEQLLKLVPKMLDYTFADLIEFINVNLGVDIPALLSAFDELAAIVTGTEGVTFESLVGIEGDIGAILEDEEMLSMDVRTLLIAYMGLSNAEELDAMVEQIIEMLKTTTAYQLFEVSQSDAELINEVADQIGEMFSYRIQIDKTGKFVRSDLFADLSDEDVLITMVLTPEKLSVNFVDPLGDNNIDLEVIPGYTPNPNAEKLAEIKKAIDETPELNEEVLGYFGLRPIYADDNTTIIGAEEYVGVFDDFTDDDGIIHLVIDVTVIDFSAPTYKSIEPVGCGEKYNYQLNFSAVVESREYFIPPALYEYAVAQCETDISYYVFLWILRNTDTEYVVDATEGYATQSEIYIGLDKATGEFPTYLSHDFVYDDEQSLSDEEVSCGEYYRDVYVCETCGFTQTDVYEKVCGETIVIDSIEYDEITNTHHIECACTCGTFATMINVEFDAGTNVALTNEIGEEFYTLNFDFALNSTGIYEVLFITEEASGYINFYQDSDYVGGAEVYDWESAEFYFVADVPSEIELYLYDYEDFEVFNIYLIFSYQGEIE